MVRVIPKMDLGVKETSSPCDKNSGPEVIKLFMPPTMIMAGALSVTPVCRSVLHIRTSVPTTSAL